MAEKERRKVNRTFCTTVPLPAPSNTERRAKVREEAWGAATAVANEDSDGGAELHPLLANPPHFLPSPVAPTGAPPRGRPQVCMVKQICTASAEEDVSWTNATSFYGEKTRRR